MSLLQRIFTLLFCLAAVPLVADEPEWHTVKNEIYLFADGSIQSSTFIWSEKRNRYLPLDAAVQQSITVSNDTTDAQSAVVDYLKRWEAGTGNIPISYTLDARPHSGKVSKVLRKYVNSRKGNNNVPTFSSTGQNVAVRAIEEFDPSFTFYNQFDFDSRNSIILLKDDPFFARNEDGSFRQPDLVAMVRIFFITEAFKNGRIVDSTPRILEVDFHVRSDLFDLPALEYQALLAGVFRMGLGYEINTWVMDLNSPNRNFDKKTFKRSNSDLWKENIAAWDNLLYSDDKAGTAGINDQPVLLPVENAVIDMAEYQVPYPHSIGDFTVYTDTVALFVTNLKAFDGGNVFKATFKAIYEKSSGKKAKKRLFTIKGNTRFYPVGQNLDRYPDYYFIRVGLGHQDDLDRLNEAIETWGTPMEIDGIAYDKALQVEVISRGKLVKGGRTQKAKQTYYFVNTGS